MFDSLSYTKKLQGKGFNSQQAVGLVEIGGEFVNENIATKSDIVIVRTDMKEMEQSIRRDMKEMEQSIRHDMKIMEITLLATFELKLSQMENRMTIRLGLMIVASLGIYSTIMTYILRH